jgi:hypothetical protein
MGLFWRGLPENTRASLMEQSTPGWKKSKERLSAFFWANADGTHWLKSVVVGKAKNPRALKDCMCILPVVYNSQNACFTREITKNWFNNHFVPDVTRYQKELLKCSDDQIKALLFLDSAPAHPNIENMSSKGGKIKCLGFATKHNCLNTAHGPVLHYDLQEDLQAQVP